MTTDTLNIILVVVPLTVSSVLSALMAWKTMRHVSEIKVEIDGRFTELLRLTKASGEATGIVNERTRVADSMSPAVSTIAAAIDDASKAETILRSQLPARFHGDAFKDRQE